ncbi:predicted protein [Chaetoceros tenuissimus]|uniref:Ricin B lectin domain-containing protein n=1 Tax=Chaetoceros tenuissimus TaxID=426638 RepID=A0AAD3CUR3_9STRA|nr:predicted protein [Chaetoceros tenuissimus]
MKLSQVFPLRLWFLFSSFLLLLMPWPFHESSVVLAETDSCSNDQASLEFVFQFQDEAALPFLDTLSEQEKEDIIADLLEKFPDLFSLFGQTCAFEVSGLANSITYPFMDYNRVTEDSFTFKRFVEMIASTTASSSNGFLVQSNCTDGVEFFRALAHKIEIRTTATRSKDSLDMYFHHKEKNIDDASLPYWQITPTSGKSRLYLNVNDKSVLDHDSAVIEFTDLSTHIDIPGRKNVNIRYGGNYEFLEDGSYSVPSTHVAWNIHLSNHEIDGLMSDSFQMIAMPLLFAINPPLPGCEMTVPTLPDYDLCLSSGPKVSAKVKFPEEISTTPRTFSFKTGSDEQGTLDALRIAYPSLFNLVNTTCFIEFHSMGKMYWSNIEDRTFAASARRFQRNAISEYSRENMYEISVDCDTVEGNTFFLSFAVEHELVSQVGPTSFRKTIYSPRLQLITESFFNSASEITPETFDEDQIAFATSLIPSSTSIVNGDVTIEPTWIPSGGSFQFRVLSYDEFGRDEDDFRFNGFPFGTVMTGESSNSDWRVNLYDHDALDGLNNNIMTFKLNAEEITFTPGTKDLYCKEKAPSMQPTSSSQAPSSSPSCTPQPSISMTMSFFEDLNLDLSDTDASEAEKQAIMAQIGEVYPWLSSLIGNTCDLQVYGFDDSTFYHNNKKTSGIPGGTVIEGEWADTYQRVISLYGPSNEVHSGNGFRIETNCTDSMDFFQYLFAEGLEGKEGDRMFLLHTSSEFRRNETDNWPMQDIMTFSFISKTDGSTPTSEGEWKLNDFSRTDLLAARIPSELFEHYPSNFIKFPGQRQTKVIFDDIDWEASYLLDPDTAVIPYPRRNSTWEIQLLNHGIEGLASGKVELRAIPEEIKIDPGALGCSEIMDIPEPILPSMKLCTESNPTLRMKITFIEEPNDRTFSFKDGVDQDETISQLGKNFTDLFEIFNTSCVLEVQNLNETFWSSVGMKQTTREEAVFTRNLRQLYSHSPYDMNFVCDDDVGEEYFKSFVQQRDVIVPEEGHDNYCNIYPEHRGFSAPSHFGIDLGSTFSGVDLDTIEGGTYVRDGFTIRFGLGIGALAGFGGGTPEGCVYDYQDEDFLPDWIGGGSFYTFSSDRSSRDEDSMYYNAFPFGENHLYRSTDTNFAHKMIFQAKLYKHPALEYLNDNVMQMWASVEEIEFIATEKCVSSNEPSQVPSTTPSSLLSMVPSEMPSMLPSFTPSSVASDLLSVSPSAFPTSFSDRTFYIKNQETNLCLSSKVDDEDVKFELATCDSARIDQQWYYDEYKFLKLRNQDDRCLQYMGHALFLGSCTQKSRYFEFELVEMEDDNYQIIAYDKKKRVHYVGCKNPGDEEDEKIKLYHEDKKKVTYEWVLEFI